MLQWQKIPVWISNLRNYRRFEVILFSYLILVSYCVTVVEVLSAANCLTMLWCRIFFTPALLIFIFLAARATPLKSIFAQARHSVVLVGVIFINFLAFLAAVLYKPNNWDSMTYHLPRIEHWLMQHNVSVYATDISRQNWMPPFGDYLSMVPRTVFGTDQFDALFSITSLVILEISIVIILKRFGVSSMVRDSCIALSLAPIVVLEATTTQVDLRASATAFAGVALLLSEFNPFAFVPILGIAIGAGIKLTSIIPLIGFVFLPTAVRKIRSAVNLKFGLGIVFGLCINLPWLLRNRSAFGSFSGPASVANAGGFSILKMAFSPGLFIIRIVGLFYSNVGQPKLHSLNNLFLSLASDVGRILKHLDFPHSKYWPDFHTAGFALNEDSAPNTIWAIIAIAVCCYCLYRRYWIRFLIFSSSILSYCFLVEWQNWPNRIFISGFTFSFIVISCTFSPMEVKLFRPYLKTAAAISILFSAVFLLMSGDRGLIKEPFINVSGTTQYFNLQPQKFAEYRELASLIDKKGIKKVALRENENSWEYPLWAMNPGTTFSSYMKNPQMILCLDECSQIPQGFLSHEKTIGLGMNVYFQ